MTHLYYVETLIDGQKHYYSHWERLHITSSVYGIVWNEYLAYGYAFTDKAKARQMRSKIIQYDRRTKCRVVPIRADLLEKSLKIVAGLK